MDLPNCLWQEAVRGRRQSVKAGIQRYRIRFNSFDTELICTSHENQNNSASQTAVIEMQAKHAVCTAPCTK